MATPARASSWQGAQTALLAVAGLTVVVGLWEGYKVIDGQLFGWTLPMRADDRSMPHVWTMVSRLGDAENRGTSRPVGLAVLSGAWYTFRLAMAGLIIGAVLGGGLAIAMVRNRWMERAALPLIIISQTIPVVALAPLVVIWGGRLKLFGWEWKPWLSVSVIAAFLAFAPIAINTLRGLQSPSAASVELMASYAATPRATLVKLRLPAALPYIIPGIRLAAAGAIVGAIVAEISIGRANGVGRLILEYSREATSDSAKVFTAIFGAAILGLITAALVSLVERFLMRHRPKESLS
jgi:NitT/TauT family transport system permease protein